jgi:hypothetical protein
VDSLAAPGGHALEFVLHDDGAGRRFRQDGHDDVADLDHVAVANARTLRLLPVDEDAVGAPAVPDGDAVPARLDHRVAARALGVVEDEVAGRIAAHRGHAAGELHLVRGAARVLDPEPQ